MKLATYQDGSRDGQLVVVSRDLSTAHFAHGIATRLQQVLDDWSFLSPQLEDLYATLNQGKARHAFAFEPALCAAPLPRAYQWLQAQAYAPHRQRLWPASDTDTRATPTAVDLVHAPSDELLGPCRELAVPPVEGGLDFGAGLAVITGDIEAGTDAASALEGVRLLALVNLWQLRPAAADEVVAFARTDAGPLPAAFGPVAVTPDELGEAWSGGRVHLPVETLCNGRRHGLCAAAQDMDAHFGQLIAAAARLRRVRAGSLVGGGIVSSADRAQGFGCLAEMRAVERQETGEARTAWLRPGDRVRIEVKGRDAQSVFGAIDQRLQGAVAGVESASEEVRA